MCPATYPGPRDGVRDGRAGRRRAAGNRPLEGADLSLLFWSVALCAPSAAPAFPTTKESPLLARADAARTRRSFSRLENVLEVPHLIDIQRRSFEKLVDVKKGGLRETIDDVSPIEDYTGNLAVVFEDISFDEPVAPISECREKDLTYARPLTVKVAFQNRETGEIREQSVFMGDFPWMTEWGTFIINGTERVVVTQLVRSPGAYVMEPKECEKQVFVANLMPARGSWLELEIDKKGKVYARIDRKRKLPVTTLLRAMGHPPNEGLAGMFEHSPSIRNTIDSDPYERIPTLDLETDFDGLVGAITDVGMALGE